MATPTRTQIQAIVDTKIVSVATDSVKTMGSGVKVIYTALLDALYKTGTQTEQDILNLVLDNIISGSLRGDVITGNGLTTYFTLLNAAVFGSYPSRRESFEDDLYKYLRNVSNRSDVTAGQSLRGITRLMLDKVYSVYTLPVPAAPTNGIVNDNLNTFDFTLAVY